MRKNRSKNKHGHLEIVENVFFFFSSQKNPNEFNEMENK